jgi:hypothetical protein
MATRLLLLLAVDLLVFDYEDEDDLVASMRKRELSGML